MKKISIITQNNDSSILRQTPQKNGIWNGCLFKINEFEDFDYAIVINYLNQDLKIKKYNKAWLLIQEPYIENLYEWVLNDHENYSRILTHHIPENNSLNYTLCPPLLPWYINKSYEELKILKPFEKEKMVSSIASNKRMFFGHKRRYEFIQYLLRQSIIDVDVYGRGINQIDNKWDGLAPYKYSFAVENTSKENYWTEKIFDPFLSYTVPIYFGCTNISDYFPKDSYIDFDINFPEKSIEKVHDLLLDPEDYYARLPALIKARNLVLEKYNFFAYISQLVSTDDEIQNDNNPCETILKKYHPSLKSKLITGSGKIIKYW